MKKLLLTFVICICASTTIFADSAEQQLINYLNRVHSMTAYFSQQAVGKSSNMRQNSSGTMALLKPGRFRWDITRPAHQMIIADGKQLWVYDVDLQQVTVQSLARSIGTSPALLISGNSEKLLNSYIVKQVDNHSSNSQWFNLQAKTKNQTFQNVDLQFIKGILTRMRLTDNLGQSSIVTFSKVRINPNINQQIFSFHPPRGVDVIRQ